MLKKLLTLCLALAILSSVALASPQTYALAAETEAASSMLEEAEPVSLTQDDMEFLLADTDGQRAEKMTQPVLKFEWDRRHNLKYNTGTTNEGGAEVLLVKAFIGKGLALEHSTIQFDAYIRGGNKDTYTAHVAPLAKTKYDEAVAAVTSGVAVSGLPEPGTATNHDSSEAVTISKSNYKNTPVTVTGSYYDENSYVDGYLYMAVEWTHTSNGPAQVDKKSEYEDDCTPCTLTVNGMKYVDSSNVTTKPASETIAADDMEILLYNETTLESEAYNFTNTSRIGLKRDEDWNDWVLVKINAGNWDLSSLTTFQFDTKMYATKAGAYTPYIAPISAGDFEAAKKGTLTEGLTAPQYSEKKDMGTTNNKTGAGDADFSVKLTASNFDSESYAGGCLYLAIEWVVESNEATAAMAFGKTSDNGKEGWNLVLEGNQYVVATPTVDDFSDAVITYDNSTGTYTITTTTTTAEAYLIIASFTGAAMNDVELVAIDAAAAEDGVIRGTLADKLADGTIKIFLWDKATLAPATAVQ